MKNRFVILITEAAVINPAAWLILWNLYSRPSASNGQIFADYGIWIFIIVYLIIMALIGLQGYFCIIKPYSAKVKALEAAAEESQKAEQIRREFVANVTHELKTPLTSISGFIETLQDGAAEEPEIRTKFIDIIAIETARLKRLIQDLLVLSDIENKKDSDFSEFNVQKAVEDTVETLKPIAEKKNIVIILDIDDDIRIKGSADRFCQMMVNLIENAIKYSNDGGHVWVKAAGEVQSGKTIISVRDEGIGIAPQHHERLFERFYRVDKSRSKKAGGTGLGLSIVKHIAVLLGATLKVESQLGRGATFFVIFNTEKEQNSS